MRGLIVTSLILAAGILPGSGAPYGPSTPSSPDYSSPSNNPFGEPVDPIIPSGPVPAPAPTSANPSTSSETPPISSAKLTDSQMHAMVLVKGDKAKGAGFLVKTPTGPLVVTNIHLLANNPNLKITTSTGIPIPILSIRAATDRDIALLSVKPGAYGLFQVASNIGRSVQTGDEVMIPNNGDGGTVTVDTSGKVSGIQPDRVEVDNSLDASNAGDPLVHTKSGKVVGVVSVVTKMDPTTDLDKTSFSSRDSAVSSAAQYVPFRLDGTHWAALDLNRFQAEEALLNQFHEQSRRLDSYLNSPENHPSDDSDDMTSDSGSNSSSGSNSGSGTNSGGSGSSNSSSGGSEPGTSGSANSNSDNPLAKLYLTDPKIVKANATYLHESSGGDAGQKTQALRGLLFDLQGIVGINVELIKRVDPVESTRARNELAYRLALKAELNAIGRDPDRLNYLPVEPENSGSDTSSSSSN